MKKQFQFFFFFALLTLIFSSCRPTSEQPKQSGTESADPIPALTEIMFSESYWQTHLGKSVQLTVQALPAGAALPADLIYSVDYDTIATVDQNGLVTPLRSGEVTVKVMDANSRFTQAKCKVRIFESYEDQKDLYMAPNGNDDASGLQIDQPVMTLERIQTILQNHAAEYDGKNVVVHIAKGTYTDQHLEWTYSGAAVVSFEGESMEETVFLNTTKKSDFFLYIYRNGQNTSFRFSGFTVKHYSNGIYLNGAKVTDTEAAAPYFYNLAFRQIGDGFTGASESSYAAIDLVSTSRATVEYCLFDRLKNTADHGLHLHAVYMATGSCDNIVRWSTFRDCVPDPIRLRHGSNRNEIYENSFRDSGYYAICSEWQKATGEEDSYGNLFHGNKIFGASNGRGKGECPLIKIFYPGSTEAQGAQPSRLSEGVAKDGSADPNEWA